MLYIIIKLVVIHPLVLIEASFDVIAFAMHIHMKIFIELQHRFKMFFLGFHSTF